MKNFEHGMGCIPSPVDPRDYKFTSKEVSMGTLPSKFSSLSMLYKVKDQGKVNSCVSFALSTAMEIKAENVQDRRSNGFIYHYRDLIDYKDEGMITREALKSAQKAGVCLWEDYKENIEVPEGYEVFNKKKQELLPEASKCKVGTYYALPIYENPRFTGSPLGMLDTMTTKQAIYQNGFVIACYFIFKNVYELTSKNPVLDYPDITDPPLGSHCVVITGWDEDNWEIVNSWGEGYGNKGIFYAPHDYPFHEAWTFDNLIVSTPAGNDGWYKESGRWRYQKDGVDQTGWIRVNNQWYFLDSDGWMLTGWIWYQGEWYWCDSSGAMAENCWRLIGGKWYWLDETGRAIRGFAEINGKTYYFCEKPYNNLKECQLLMTDESGAVK